MRELRVALLRDSPSSFGRTLADALAQRLGFGDAAR